MFHIRNLYYSTEKPESGLEKWIIVLIATGAVIVILLIALLVVVVSLQSNAFVTIPTKNTEISSYLAGNDVINQKTVGCATRRIRGSVLVLKI